MIARCFLIAAVFSLSPAMGSENFESLSAGPLESAAGRYGTFSAEKSHAAVLDGKGVAGGRALHVTGGTERRVTLEFKEPLREKRALRLSAERWTRQGGFDFLIEARNGGGWSVLTRRNDIKVGGYHTQVTAEVPTGSSGLRLTCSSAAGVLVDDLSLAREGPMTLENLSVHTPVVPVLRHKKVNPALGFTLGTDGSQSPIHLEAVEISLEGSARPADIERVEIVPGGLRPEGAAGEPVASAREIRESLVLTAKRTLEPGDNTFWVSVVLKENAAIDGRVAVSLKRVKAGGRVVTPDGSASVTQRIGVALRQQGDDGSHSYRIPGLVRTKAGSLIAVYDIRYQHCGDLPAKIDVGVSRSPDGGQTWEPMRVAMHCGTMGDKYQADGVGDPAILVDEKTGRIWLAALWSHGNRAWGGSGPGLTPEETGQLLLCHSDDDGRTWSALRNITPAIKDPAWRLVFNGPGAGITMKDGTLVFAAQFRAADGGETKGKPFSTILWSKDRGESWHIGTGCRIDTTEAQVAELADGSLMLNCRDNRGGSRTVMVTRDLGKSWSPHATDRGALPEPVCMASLLRWDHPRHGAVFVFSNPATTGGRHHMTLKFSKDDAATWPDRWHALYDVRSCAGYSCLAPAGDDHLGVLYEGPCELYFLRVPLDECLK